MIKRCLQKQRPYRQRPAAGVIHLLLLLSLASLLLPGGALADDAADRIKRIGQLSEGMTGEQLQEVRRLIDERLDALRTGKTDPGTAGTAYGAAGRPGGATRGRLSLEVGQKFFLYNLEGDDYKLRNARTFFGDIVDATLSYRIGENARIRAGVVAILPFAEDRFDLRWGNYYRDFTAGDHSDRKVNLLQPYLQLSYDAGDFRVIFGDLQTPHAYHMLVEYDVYEFLRPTEKGLQVLYAGRHFSQDLYVNWREKNTPGHHERFNMGSISKVAWDSGSLALQLLYVHRGGVEFPQDPTVFENIAGVLVFDQSVRVGTYHIDRAGIEIVPLVTSDLPPVSEALQSRRSGFGALGSIYATSGSWLLKAGYWSGSSRVYAEEGLPFSSQERFVYAQVLFSRRLRQDMEIRAMVTGGSFGKNLRESFFDQKMVVTWRHDFALGR